MSRWAFLKIVFLTLAIWLAATLTYVFVANAMTRLREGALPRGALAVTDWAVTDIVDNSA